MNLNQRIFIVRNYQDKKHNIIKEKYERKFGTPRSTRKAILSLIRKFDVTGSVHQAKGAGRPKSTQMSPEEIREMVLASPRVSLRTQENERGISRSRLQRVIKNELRLRSYHLQVLHHLHERDYQVRTDVCTELLRRWRTEDLENKILFSDEAVFHVCGRVNRHNTRTWASERPADFIE